MFNCSLFDKIMCEVLAVCFYDVAVKQHYCNTQESIIIIAWDDRSKTRKDLEEVLLQWPFSSHAMILVELDPFLTLSENKTVLLVLLTNIIL